MNQKKKHRCFCSEIAQKILCEAGDEDTNIENVWECGYVLKGPVTGPRKTINFLLQRDREYEAYGPTDIVDLSRNWVIGGLTACKKPKK